MMPTEVNMGKKSLALASLVMAIPAGGCFWFSLRAALDYGENMPLIGTAIVWTLVVLSALIALSPIIFLIMGPKASAANAPSAAAAELAPVAAAPAKKGKKNEEEEAFDEEEGEPMFQDEAADAEGDFDDNFDIDDDAADLDDFEEEEEQPKKKKKR